MTATRTWLTVALAAGVMSSACLGPKEVVEPEPMYTVNGTYTVEQLATFSEDTLGIRIAALDHRDESKTVTLATQQPASADACADVIVQTLTESGLPAGRYGDLILIERTREPSRRPVRPGREALGEPAPHEGHITSVDEWSYTIDRAYMATELADIDGFKRQGRIIPHRNEAGETDGFRISGIRRRSLADALGFRNGDIVHSVGEQPLDSMQSAMDAYQILQDADQFTVELSRRGQRHTISYEVQ